MMAYVHLPPPPCLPSSLPPVTVISRCHCVAPGRSAYSEGKTETVSLPYALLHNSPESCETGCSIVNYPKGQTQHLFSPCSPWDELTDPQTYRPLSADRKDQLFAAPGVQRTARHQESQQKKRNEIKIKKNTHDNKTPLKLCSPPSLSGNLLHECFTAPRSSPCHVCIFNFLCCMRIKRDVQKGKERKKKNNDAISASAQPGAELCVSHSHNTRGKTWLQPPPDVCQDPHGTKKTRSA